jgi:hypothetical protein
MPRAYKTKLDHLIVAAFFGVYQLKLAQIRYYDPLEQQLLYHRCQFV